MSMHKNPLTYMEKRGLHAHGLPTDKPSQLSDAFRAGVAWAGHEVQSLKNELEAKVRQNVHLMRERDAYRTAEEYQIALRQKLEEERDSLAAHVERIKAEESRAYKGGLSMPGLLHDIIYESPTISLVSRDLLKRAEVLEAVAAMIKSDATNAMHGYAMHRAASIALSNAALIRQQAEALT